MKLYRIFPFDESAAPNERGGALYVPGSTAGRIANPDLYKELYVCAQPEAAVAETFGRLARWRSVDFVHASGQPYALATYELPDGAAVFDLNDVDALRSIGVTHPADVVTRDRKKTSAWARIIFESAAYIGAQWWCYYNPDWRSMGLWDVSGISMCGTPEIIGIDHPVVKNAAAAIVRQVSR